MYYRLNLHQSNRYIYFNLETGQLEQGEHVLTPLVSAIVEHLYYPYFVADDQNQIKQIREIKEYVESQPKREETDLERIRRKYRDKKEDFIIFRVSDEYIESITPKNNNGYIPKSLKGSEAVKETSADSTEIAKVAEVNAIELIASNSALLNLNALPVAPVKEQDIKPIIDTMKTEEKADPPSVNVIKKKCTNRQAKNQQADAIKAATTSKENEKPTETTKQIDNADKTITLPVKPIALIKENNSKTETSASKQDKVKQIYKTTPFDPALIKDGSIVIINKSWLLKRELPVEITQGRVVVIEVKHKKRYIVTYCFNRILTIPFEEIDSIIVTVAPNYAEIEIAKLNCIPFILKDNYVLKWGSRNNPIADFRRNAYSHVKIEVFHQERFKKTFYKMFKDVAKLMNKSQCFYQRIEINNQVEQPPTFDILFECLFDYLFYKHYRLCSFVQYLEIIQEK